MNREEALLDRLNQLINLAQDLKKEIKDGEWDTEWDLIPDVREESKNAISEELDVSDLLNAAKKVEDSLNRVKIVAQFFELSGLENRINEDLESLHKGSDY